MCFPSNAKYTVSKTNGRAETGDRDADSSKKEIRLYLLSISTKQVDHYNWVEETFEALHPDIDIVFEQFPGSSLKDFEIKLKLRLASKKAPDVVGVSYTLAAELAELGLLAEAPQYIVDEIQQVSRNEMIRTAPKFGDKWYGMVSDASPTALYYNKEMFREAGLDPERPPKTLDELVEYADLLTVRDEDGNPTRAGLSLRKTGFKAGIAEKYFTFLFSMGGKAFSDDGHRALFNDEQGRRALEIYDEVLFRKKIDSVDLEGDQQGFGQQRAAMFIREVHVIRWLAENYPELEFGVAPIPAGAASISAGGPYMFVVPDDSDVQEDAWELISYLMSEDVYKRYSSIGGVVPTINSVANDSLFVTDEKLQVFVKQDMRAVGPFPRMFQATDILGAYLERFCYGQLSVEETLNRAEEDINALLAVS